jgi:glycopeptide antibiotics resistance protein
MMTNLDLKWLLPFVLPFLILFTVRLLVWAAGLSWDAKFAGVTVLLAATIGGVIGIGVVATMHDTNEKLTTKGVVSK